MRKLIRKVTPQIAKNIYHAITRRKSKREKIKFGFDINKHCNLNCKGCDHFSCLEKEKYASQESVKKDLVQMRKIFGDDVEQISILGGEPLLNPDVVEYCTMTRDIFCSANITIITNGTLLLKMNDDFWECCKRNNISICATKYPIDFPYEKAEKLAREKGVSFKYQENGNVLKTMYCVPIDENGKQNPQISFNMCGKGNECITLENGRLYTCTLIPNISTFNSFFGKNIPVSDEDSIDIYSGITADEILKRLATPVPFCRYCNHIKYRTGIKWEPTSKDIHEWT